MGGGGVGEMAQQLRALTALAKDPAWIASPHAGQFKNYL